MSRDPIERSLEIEQAQLRGFARTFAEVEWLLLILVFLYLFIGNPALARNVVVSEDQNRQYRGKNGRVALRDDAQLLEALRLISYDSITLTQVQ